ncbi:MAG TPA: NnrS family protein [Burkholderiales bacterium]|nr:NnrS family protein [Burkholderiales bacterium]
MATIPIHDPVAREPRHQGVAFLSAGFRPFFLLGAAWATVAVPLWLAAYVHGYALPGSLPAMVWHAHEMIYGYALAAVTGFLLTAIPNWTGRLPIRGAPLGALVALWLVGRIAFLASSAIGPWAAAAIDLAFTAVLIATVAREVTAAQNYHNLPVVGVLALLLAGNTLVHLHALDIAYTAALGNRIGVATLIALIALIGGRIVPSFTRNWLAKQRPDVRPPAPHDRLDTACLLVVVIGLVAWVSAPDSQSASVLTIAAGLAAALRLARWRGLATAREPLLLILHVGYAWVAIGLLLIGTNGIVAWAPPGAPLHALTVGAIGTMTLAVMTRASLGHTGRELRAGPGTVAIYILVTLAALLRVAAPLSGDAMAEVSALAGLAWSGAFGLFAILYAPLLMRPR